MQEGATSRRGGVPLKKEAGESDSFVTTGREANHLAHVGADVRLPGQVGLFARAVDVAGRVGQRVLPGVPVDVWESLVREELPVVLSQEPRQIRGIPATNIRADLRTARACPE